MDEERFRQGAARCGRAAGIYWRKGDPGVDAPQPWQAAEGGQKGQPDAAARPGRAGGIPAGGERLAGAHQRSAAGEHAPASEIDCAARAIGFNRPALALGQLRFLFFSWRSSLMVWRSNRALPPPSLAPIPREGMGVIFSV